MRMIAMLAAAAAASATCFGQAEQALAPPRQAPEKVDPEDLRAPDVNADRLSRVRGTKQSPMSMAVQISQDHNPQVVDADGDGVPELALAGYKIAGQRGNPGVIILYSADGTRRR